MSLDCDIAMKTGLALECGAACLLSTVMFRDQNNWVQTSVANQRHVMLCLKKPMVEWTTPFNFCTLRRYCGWLRNPAPAGRLFMPLLS